MDFSMFKDFLAENIDLAPCIIRTLGINGPVSPEDLRRQIERIQSLLSCRLEHLDLSQTPSGVRGPNQSTVNYMVFYSDNFGIGEAMRGNRVTHLIDPRFTLSQSLTNMVRGKDCPPKQQFRIICICRRVIVPTQGTHALDSAEFFRLPDDFLNQFRLPQALATAST